MLTDHTNTLISNKIEASNKTIAEYVKYLCEAYAFYKVRRYDIKGKRYLTSTDKYYLSDHAFRYAKLGTKVANFGDTYENIVAIELMRRGYDPVMYNLTLIPAGVIDGSMVICQHFSRQLF